MSGEHGPRWQNMPDVLQKTDKLRLCLTQRLEAMERRREWIAPAGILVTLILTLASTSFRDFILPKDTWGAIFILASVACLAWLGHSLWRLRGCPSVEDVVAEIKRGSALGAGG